MSGGNGMDDEEVTNGARIAIAERKIKQLETGESIHTAQINELKELILQTRKDLEGIAMDVTRSLQGISRLIRHIGLEEDDA